MMDSDERQMNISALVIEAKRLINSHATMSINHILARIAVNWAIKRDIVSRQKLINLKRKLLGLRTIHLSKQSV